MTLIEVMVSVLIFAVGVLGLVAVQARASQLANDAEDRNRAALLANEAVALLWEYVPTSAAVPPVMDPTAYANWQAEVANPVNGAGNSSSGLLGLPNANGTVTSALTPYGSYLYTVTITWQESGHQTTGVSGQNQYITQVAIP
jgi:type IV pilus assembly protein PilV